MGADFLPKGHVISVSGRAANGYPIARQGDLTQESWRISSQINAVLAEKDAQRRRFAIFQTRPKVDPSFPITTKDSFIHVSTIMFLPRKPVWVLRANRRPDP